MPLSEAILQALQTAWSHKLRSFFTLLGIIVSVGFLVAVVAVIQGMNAYVRERIAGAIVGINAFQIRRDPIQVGFIDDEAWKKIQRRPIIGPEDVSHVEHALPDAQAISLQSGWPTPMADVQWRNRTVGDVLVFGVTPPFVVVQDYAFAAGAPFTDVDERQRRLVAVLGFDVAEKLFGTPELAVDTGEGLIAFWGKLTRVIFTVVPAVVGIGIVVGGIVIMNIMLMSVTERTREIGILKSLGASRRDIRRQFLAESAILSLLGGVAGLLAGSGLAALVEVASPLPARVTAWSVAVALGLGISVGIVFGVYPAHRAARLDPIEAL